MTPPPSRASPPSRGAARDDLPPPGRLAHRAGHLPAGRGLPGRRPGEELLDPAGRHRPGRTGSLDALQTEIDELEARTVALEDPDEVERLAREEYHYVYPGEEAFVVLPAAPAPLPIPAGWPFDALRGATFASRHPPTDDRPPLAAEPTEARPPAGTDPADQRYLGRRGVDGPALPLTVRSSPAGASMSAPIEASGLVRRFGDILAVDGVDLAVQDGEVFGFLGPNGAGKSTVVRMLTTLLRPSAGTARVAGYDVVDEAPHGQALDRCRTAGRGHRPAHDRPGAPPAPVDPARHPPQGGDRAWRGPARPGRAHRRRRSAGRHLLRRHAPPTRPGPVPRAPAQGPVPRRADDRSRPDEPDLALGGGPQAERLRHDRAPHDAVPRGGRPAGQPHRHHRPGPDRAPGDTDRAEGATGLAHPRGRRRGRAGRGGPGGRRRPG